MPKISEYTNGNPPVDADQLVGARAGANVSWTWANIKATLKTYFDALYATVAHSSASAAVHGLPASVNVLGNRNAAGEFVQRGTVAGGTTGGALTLYYRTTGAVTFLVAFSTAPVVLYGSSTDAELNFGCAFNISTTGFVGGGLGDATSRAAANANWIALGA